MVFALGLCGFGWFTRATFGSTAVNRRALASAVCLFFGQTSLGLAAWMLEIPLTTTLILTIVVWAIVVALLAIHFDRRLAISAVGYLTAFFVAARWPAARPFAASTSNLVLAINILHTWTQARRVETRSDDRTALSDGSMLRGR
jgi:hypothetical protein